MTIQADYHVRHCDDVLLGVGGVTIIADNNEAVVPARSSAMSEKLKVAFICVHNSCRSQMAEAIANVLAGDVLEAYSAGTETKDFINPDAIAVIKELYGVDVIETQRPKLLSEIPPVDVVITMGCNVECPYLPCKRREDWGLDDPTGKGREAFLHTAGVIKEKVLKLKYQFT